MFFSEDLEGHKIEVEETDSNVKVFEAAASSSNSELLYAYDANGNQVAIGLIYDGKFDAPENGDESEFHGNSASECIGIQEECVTTEMQENYVGDSIEPEAKNEAEEDSTTVRVYKQGNKSGKKLMDIKRKLAKLRQARNESQRTVQKKSLVEYSKRCQVQRKRKVKTRTDDKAYKPSGNFGKMKLQSKGIT